MSLWAPAALLYTAAYPQRSPPCRRRVYDALVPWDRGDFGWELIVPWTNKTLTPMDKIIVCTTFIGMAFGLQQVQT